MIGDNSAVVTEEVVAVSNRHLVKFVFLRWSFPHYWPLVDGQLCMITQLQRIFFDLQWSLLKLKPIARSGKSRLYQPGGNSDGVGTMVRCLVVREDLFALRTTFLLSNSPCWNKLVVSLHLRQSCILEFFTTIVCFFNPSGSSPVWGLVPERGVFKGEASNLRGANLMMSKREAVKNYLADFF